MTGAGMLTYSVQYAVGAGSVLLMIGIPYALLMLLLGWALDRYTRPAQPYAQDAADEVMRGFEHIDDMT